MFFSVKKNLKIAGKVYIPCVCYDLPEQLVLTVKKLEAEGKACIHEEEVGFMNGKILVKEKKQKKVAKKEVKKEVVMEESSGF